MVIQFKEKHEKMSYHSLLNKKGLILFLILLFLNFTKGYNKTTKIKFRSDSKCLSTDDFGICWARARQIPNLDDEDLKVIGNPLNPNPSYINNPKLCCFNLILLECVYKKVNNNFLCSKNDAEETNKYFEKTYYKNCKAFSKMEIPSCQCDINTPDIVNQCTFEESGSRLQDIYDNTTNLPIEQRLKDKSDLNKSCCVLWTHLGCANAYYGDMCTKKFHADYTKNILSVYNNFCPEWKYGPPDCNLAAYEETCEKRADYEITDCVTNRTGLDVLDKNEKIDVDKVRNLNHTNECCLYYGIKLCADTSTKKSCKPQLLKRTMENLNIFYSSICSDYKNGPPNCIETNNISNNNNSENKLESSIIFIFSLVILIHILKF